MNLAVVVMRAEVTQGPVQRRAIMINCIKKTWKQDCCLENFLCAAEVQNDSMSCAKCQNPRT
jgi:hypothetical protein